jgi:hypothetical protein
LPNRLQHEVSPYLLQHKDNPVDWYPWGNEALERAQSEDKPILVSIGYSACHWCHVMAHESFEDPAVAELLNEKFISIKVDREERPDIDNIYMTAVQAMTGQGGWPLNCFLTPQGLPFFGGTYWPPTDRSGMPSPIHGQANAMTSSSRASRFGQHSHIDRIRPRTLARLSRTRSIRRFYACEPRLIHKTADSVARRSFHNHQFSNSCSVPIT